MRLFASGRAPQGSHFLQAFLIPQAYAFSTFYALRHLLSFPWAWYAPYLVLLGLGSTLVSAWMRRQLMPGWRRLYFWAVLAAGLWAVNGWFLTGSLGLSGSLLLGWGISLALSYFSWWYMAQLRGRARLWAHLRPYQGEDLRARARDYQEDANFTPANRAKLIGLLRVLTAVQVALAFGFWQPDSLARAGLWLVALVNLEALYRAYRQEMEWLSLGHRLRLDQGLTRALSVLLLSTLALVLAGWLADRVPRYDWGYQAEPPAPRPVYEPVPQPRQNIYDVPTPRPELPGWVLTLRAWIFPAIGKVLEWSVRYGLPVLVAVLVIVPGLRLLREVRWRPRELWGALVRRWLRFLHFWRSLWAVVRKRPPPEPLVFYPTNREIWLRELRQSQQSRRRRPHNQLVRGFLLLLDVGQDLGVSYRQGMTTRAYLNALGVVLSGQGLALERLADLLDAGFFRPTPLDAHEVAEWKSRLFTVLDAARRARHNSAHDHSTQNPQ